MVIGVTYKDPTNEQKPQPNVNLENLTNVKLTHTTFSLQPYSPTTEPFLIMLKLHSGMGVSDRCQYKYQLGWG